MEMQFRKTSLKRAVTPRPLTLCEGSSSCHDQLAASLQIPFSQATISQDCDIDGFLWKPLSILGEKMTSTQMHLRGTLTARSTNIQRNKRGICSKADQQRVGASTERRKVDQKESLQRTFVLSNNSSQPPWRMRFLLL